MNNGEEWQRTIVDDFLPSQNANLLGSTDDTIADLAASNGSRLPPLDGNMEDLPDFGLAGDALGDRWRQVFAHFSLHVVDQFIDDGVLQDPHAVGFGHPRDVRIDRRVETNDACICHGSVLNIELGDGSNAGTEYVGKDLIVTNASHCVHQCLSRARDIRFYQEVDRFRAS